MTKINNSNYSFEIKEDGNVKLYRHDEDVTADLAYNIVIDMAYMIEELSNKLNQITKVVNDTIEAYKDWDYDMCKHERANGMRLIEDIIKND